MPRRRRHRPRRKTVADLNITAFMNLMVVLVPFLLMTAVFTHLSILELNLPKPGSGGAKNQTPALELQVVIRKDALYLGDNKGGLIKRIAFDRQGRQYHQLTEVLKQVKARFPDKSNINILSEPDTPYDTLVQVMDAVRAYTAIQDGEVILAELFPEIAIGDAPR